MVVGEFLFLVTKSLKSRSLDLLSNHEICFQKLSFSSRNWRKLQISRFFFAKILVLFLNQKTDLDISLFKIRDMDSVFLFLFSISLFGISSMPATPQGTIDDEQIGLTPPKLGSYWEIHPLCPNFDGARILYHPSFGAWSTDILSSFHQPFPRMLYDCVDVL